MNFIKLRFIPYTISMLFIIASIILLLLYGLNFSNEFKGGTTIKFTSKASQKEIKDAIKKDYNQNFIINSTNNLYFLSIDKSIEEKDLVTIKKILLSKQIEAEITEISVVSPTVGSELISKTLIAVVISVIVIFIFIAYAFKNSISAISAIIAMLHDTFILLGFFALFGNFFNAEVDLLIVTAVLTVLSFSLYDTIVIFDRVRENIKKQNVLDYIYVLDISIKETMVRSINNSLTSILALFSLSLFVSGPIYWFSVALLIGVIFGTYSSPFVAVTLFYDIDKLVKKLKNRK